MGIWSCDFETNNNTDDCHVWCWGAREVYTGEIYKGTTISSYVDWVLSHSSTGELYFFHNLAFDGEFLLLELFNRGYVHTLEQKLLPGEMNTLISDMGQWYSIRLCYRKKVQCEFRDSLKILPFSVKEMAKSFHMEESKGSIDYNLNRPLGYEPTSAEWEYLLTDLAIPAHGIKYLFDNGDIRLTAGSNALASYKHIVGKNFRYWFPSLDDSTDEFIRRSYRGGWVYANPKYKGKKIGKGIILDVNSLYPSRMKYELLPWGTPIYYKGRYKETDNYPLYVQRINVSFTLKKGKLPTIQEKHNPRFRKTEYLTSSNGEILQLTLTNVDLTLFLENYNIEIIEYIDGYMFKGAHGMFDDYIDYWMKQKEEATMEKDYAKRTMAKLKMNSLYGKFAKRPVATQKIPYVADGVLKLKLGEEENIGSLYIPVGTFITAYARNYTIRSAQKLGNRFLYSDTDSLHLKGTTLPDGLEIHDSHLGAWKNEGTFIQGKYLGPKAYCEKVIVSRETLDSYLQENPDSTAHVDYKKSTLLQITCAGMPANIKSGVTFDNFEVSLELSGKLRPQHVKGGIVLANTTFTLKPR